MPANVMPEPIAKIRDAAVAYAIGEGPPPDEVQLLYDWLFWESDDPDLQEFRMYFTWDYFELTDDAVRWNMDLKDDDKVDDSLRLKYVRERLDRLQNDGEDLTSGHAVRLCREDGVSSWACCTVEVWGQGGAHPTWHGFFPSREAFWEFLEQSGLCCFENGPDEIDDDQIRKAWFEAQKA